MLEVVLFAPELCQSSGRYWPLKISHHIRKKNCL